MFITEGAFFAHLGSLHPDLTADDVQALLDMSLTVREDTREYCPLCFIPVVRLARGQNLLKHNANHMERLACFALPRDVGLDGDLEDDESLKNQFDSSDRSDGSRLMSDYDTASEQSEADAPPLYRESWEDSAHRVRALLEAGADLNAQGGKYGNALQAASYKGHTKIVETLLEYRANVNAQGGHFGNALQAASYKGYTDIVEALLESGADVNAQGGHFGSALQATSYKGHKSVVNLLLSHGANVDARGGEFDSALQAAAAQGHEDVVQTLLERGADVNLHGSVLGSALQVASYKGHKAVARLLLDRGADVHVQGGLFHTALQAAAQHGHTAIVQLLLDQGADVNTQGGELGCALQAAASQGHSAIVQLLIDCGAEINIQGGKLGCALQAACLQDNEAIIRLLLDRGADVNPQGGDFGSPLQAASVRGDETVVRLLLDSGADVNWQGGENKSALQTASAAGHERIVRILLDRGAVDVDFKGVHGGAYRAALDAGYDNIAQLLQLHQPLATADRPIVLDLLSANRPLWLLHTETMTLVESPADTPYAILSHTWSEEEPQFHEVRRGRKAKYTLMEGWSKIVRACKQAFRDGLQYLWADACCIDKRSSVESSEAIHSMFDYYRGAAVCYVHMTDVTMNTTTAAGIPSAFSKSRWHTRGWTLQELLAPRSVHFYDCTWTFIGTLSHLADIVAKVTEIPGPMLRHETALQGYSIAQRLSWAANRQTKQPEDRSYALLGIFGVHMPLIYGEGRTNAFLRLQEKLLLKGDDLSVLAWAPGAEDEERPRLLATSLADFRDCGGVLATKAVVGTFEIIRTISSLKIPEAADEIVYVSLHCRIAATGNNTALQPGKPVPLRLQEVWLVTHRALDGDETSMTLKVGSSTPDTRPGMRRRLAIGPVAGVRETVQATIEGFPKPR
ncbi:hypothetical protein LTR97_009158 [Elasticomyces elasticus]|uniref:Heterokaryon incompatibility domain-containing protein n=1 Tax=Elasticomyces elasticus TaxID=574655 RepID=A0AAN7VN61_9PEZI|nr:hypothetical protein LTR97_009158 [Elasticomyces elasticus]